MKIIETQAIVLKSFSLSEADRIVTFLTEENGLERLSLRGAKRLQNRFGGRVELFSTVKILYRQKEDTELGRLDEVEIIESFFHLAAKTHVYQALSHLAEVLLATTPMHEPNHKLYRMMRACLKAVADFSEQPLSVLLVIGYFEIWLLRLAGFWPDFRRCAECRARLLSDNSIYYSPADAQVRCAVCFASEKRAGETLPANVAHILRGALIQPPAQFVSAAQQSKVTAKAINNLTRPLLRRLLEYTPSFWATDFIHEDYSTSDK